MCVCVLACVGALFHAYGIRYLRSSKWGVAGPGAVLGGAKVRSAGNARRPRADAPSLLMQERGGSRPLIRIVMAKASVLGCPGQVS